MNIHKKIEALMARYGFSQQMLADKVGVSQRSVSDWCKTSVPRQAAIKKLSEVFRIDPDVLLDDGLDIPEWEPPQKVKDLYGRPFSDHLKKIKKDSDVVAEEAHDPYGPESIIPILLSIDESLKKVAEALQAGKR